MEELNATLQERCHYEGQRQLRGRGQPVAQAWEEEKEHFLPLFALLPIARRSQSSV